MSAPRMPELPPEVAAAVQRAEMPDFPRWQQMINATGGCAQPIRLRGERLTVDAVTGELIESYSTDSEPTGYLLTACENRRASRCPACAEVYRDDTYHLIISGLSGGKEVPESVSSHPRVFLTLTAPSFGAVHSNWVNTYRREHAGEEPPLTVSERARLRELEREARELRLENELPEKSRSVLCQRSSVSDKFEFIDAQHAAGTTNTEPALSTVRMCVLLEVSRSGFYEWRTRPASATAERREELKVLITKSFDDSDGTYGYRRVHADLAAWGVPCGPELVRSLMRELGLEPCQPKPWRFSLTENDGQEHHIPDLVRRDFTAEAPGQKMVGRARCRRWTHLDILDLATDQMARDAMASGGSAHECLELFTSHAVESGERDADEQELIHVSGSDVEGFVLPLPDRNGAHTIGDAAPSSGRLAHDGGHWYPSQRSDQ
jgi:hypothetical protein